MPAILTLMRRGTFLDSVGLARNGIGEPLLNELGIFLRQDITCASGHHFSGKSSNRNSCIDICQMEISCSSLGREGLGRNLAALDVCGLTHLAAAAKIVLRCHDAWSSENRTSSFDVTMRSLTRSY
jgi:hypothetical protein